jgi:hypothetical protein
MPRVIQLPLSGGDRKAQAKELRRARGLYDEYMRQATVVRAEAREKDRKADRLECNAWNAIMFCGGPAQPSPNIETALNAGYDRLEVRCNRCGRLSRADLRRVRRSGDTPLHQLEAALFCQECSQSKKWKQRAHIVGLACDTQPDAEPPRRALPRGCRG